MPYPLYSRRLRIEPLASEDIDAFVAYRQIAEVARWQAWTPEFSRVDAEALLEAQSSYNAVPPDGARLRLAVRPIDGLTLWGDVSFAATLGEPDSYELGATVHPDHQGQGYAVEAVERLVQFLFEDAKAHRLVAHCDHRNVGAAAVLDSVGFRRESHRVEAEFVKGEWVSVDGYALLAREYGR